MQALKVASQRNRTGAARPAALTTTAAIEFAREKHESSETERDNSSLKTCL